MAMNDVAMAALLNETLQALASPTVHGTSSTISVFILSILGIGGLALLILSCCCQCFRENRRRPQSQRSTSGSYSVSLEEDDDRRPLTNATSGSDSECMEGDKKRSWRSPATRGTYSEYLRSPMRDERSFHSGSVMGSILLVMALLAALAALVVGTVKLLVWLVRLCNAIWLADFWDSATAWVIQTWNSTEMLVVLVVGISLALLILLYCGLWVIGFEGPLIVLGSFAAGWMSLIGNVVAGSFFALLQAISAGGISAGMVLLYIVPCVALVVGAFEIILWLVHSGAIYAPTWLVDFWDSSSAWVHHAWNSVEILGRWHSFVAWLHNFWDSATNWVHHAWDSVEILGWWHSFVNWLHSFWNSATGWVHHAWDSVEIFGWWHSFVAWLHSFWDSATGWVHHAWDSVEIFGWWHSFVAWLHNLWDSVEIFGWWHSFVAWLHNLWESITDHHKWKIYT